jgi:voltage-dependent calcium channel T type alpha-1G
VTFSTNLSIKKHIKQSSRIPFLYFFYLSQPIVNYNEWRLLYFIAFILLVGFFVLNMFVGVVVENFHRCREEQEKEEKIRRAAKRAIQMEKKRRRMHMPPYYTNYSPLRMFVHNVVTSKYFDLAIAAVIGLNVVTMAMEYYMMPLALEYALKIFNYFFTAVFILEALMKLVALGIRLYMKDKWNQLDVAIVILSIVGIVLEELETKIIPINPTIIRVMRVLRIARVLKLLKMAKGIRALLDTVMQALPQVRNAFKSTFLFCFLSESLINGEFFFIFPFYLETRSVTWGCFSFCCSSSSPLSVSSSSAA